MTTRPKLCAIWAEDRNGVIGSGTAMLWRVPADLAHFKDATTGSPLIMGRHSWEALGGALPDRLNIVITSQAGYVAPGAQVASSLSDAIAIAEADSPETIWIAGGGQVYRQALELVDELVVSYLDLDVGGGDQALVYAPTIDADKWKIDATRSDQDWRPRSGDARWRQTVYVRSL